MLTTLALWAVGLTAGQAPAPVPPPQNFQVLGVVQKAFDGYDLVTTNPNGQRVTFHLLFDRPTPPLPVGGQFVATGLPVMIPNGVRNYLVVQNIAPAPNQPPAPVPPSQPQPPNPPAPVPGFNASQVFDVTGTPMLRISGLVTCPSPAYTARLVFVKKCKYGLKLAVRLRRQDGLFPQVVTQVPVSYTVNRYTGGFRWVEAILLIDIQVVSDGLR